MADVLLSKPTSNKTILHMREYLGPAVARVVGDTVTNNTINPSSTTLNSPSIPKRRRKKDQGETKTNKKTPFFQETVPTLRATADSTAKRPRS